MKNGKKNSVKIGSFAVDKQGVMHGKIYGLGLSITPVMFEPQTSKDGKRYFRLIAEPAKSAYEIGAAFPREKDGMVYHSVSIDSPVLSSPINAALFADKESGGLNLVWSRQEDAKEPKAEATVNFYGQPQVQTRRPNGQQLDL
ncbi:MAG: DUF736 family protein [Bdellovibrionales bacterium]